MTDATQQGVSKREEDFEALIASRAAERGEGPAAEVQKDTQEEVQGKEVAEGEEATEEEKKPTISFTDEDGTQYEIPASARMRLKVDGAEVEETIDRMTRGYQKGAAADKRLEQASAKQRELEDKERALNARGYALTQQEQAVLSKLQNMEEKHQAGRLSPDAYREKAEELVSALLDDDDPISRVAKILPSLAAPQAEQVDLGKLQKDLKTSIRSEMELDEARDKFYQEFKDLADDPALHHLVNERTKILVGENPHSKPWAIIKMAAEEVTEWKRKFAPVETAPAKPTPTPRQAAGRATIGKDVKPETREDVLNEMRKLRGQSPI